MGDIDRKIKTIKDIKDNYRQLEKSIVNQLYMKNRLHGTTAGSAREGNWKQLFDMVLPKKFVMEHSVFIIDSEDGISHEVDLAIIDQTYTPYIFRYGELKFIPIEAVAAVVECKSTSISKEQIRDWKDSIVNLKTNGESIARLATEIAISAVPTQLSTRPIRLLCALKENVDDEIKQQFDFVLLAVKKEDSDFDNSYIEITSRPEFDNLFQWYKDLNMKNQPYTLQREKTEGERNDRLAKAEEKLLATKLDEYTVTNENGCPISLLTFNFQFNQLLMLINNPMLFPHKSYANMFDKK